MAGAILKGGKIGEIPTDAFYTRFFSDVGSSVAISRGVSDSAFNFGTGDFTLEWCGRLVFPNGVNGALNIPLVEKFDDNFNSGSGFSLHLNSYNLKGRVGGTTLTPSPSLFLGVPNKTCHFALTRSGSTITLYLNGISKSSGTNSENIDNAFFLRIHLRNGRNVDGEWRYTRIHNVARDSTWLQAHMNDREYTGDANCIGLWYPTTTLNSASDYSGNGRNGSISNDLSKYHIKVPKTITL